MVGADVAGDGDAQAGFGHPASVGWRTALRRALTPLPGKWGLAPGLRAAAAAAIVLAGSVLVADLGIGGIAYLGVACAVSFVGRGDYRSRAAMVGAQAVGAGVGMTIGALVPDTVPWVIAAAVVVGVLAGMIGRIGPASTGGAVMAVIGVAYTQFGRLQMPWWEPVLAYAVGSALLLGLSIAGALVHRDRYRRLSVSAVFDAAADLLESPPGRLDDARHRLATASATARVAVAGYRRRSVTGRLGDAWSDARDAAALAAQMAVDPGVTPSEAVPELCRRWRARAEMMRTGAPDEPEAGVVEPRLPAPTSQVRAAARAATGPEALWTGARIGLCVGAATALAIVLHPPQHAFWIPLTVAVVLRPEYGAVLVRSLHRLGGTIIGVGAAALLLAITSSPVWLSLFAALSLGMAAFAAPRMYGLAVVGITGSALLSVAFGDPHGVEPWARLLDTVLGCAIALVAGVLLWPRRGVPDQSRAFARAAAALARQIDLELGRDAAVSARGVVTDEAYRTAHAWRAELERNLAEPDPTHAAAAWLPVALQLERTVDAVCAAGTRARDRPEENALDRRPELLDQLRDRPVQDTTPTRAAAQLAAIVADLSA